MKLYWTRNGRTWALACSVFIIAKRNAPSFLTQGKRQEQYGYIPYLPVPVVATAHSVVSGISPLNTSCIARFGSNFKGNAYYRPIQHENLDLLCQIEKTEVVIEAVRLPKTKGPFALTLINDKVVHFTPVLTHNILNPHAYSNCIHSTVTWLLLSSRHVKKSHLQTRRNEFGLRIMLEVLHCFVRGLKQ